MSYTYDPETNMFHIPASVLQRMIYRIGASKEKVEAEDDRENERRVRATRAGR